ncbi:hypothetical protein ABZX95_06200 [Streptomyces sp. NPDC004232]|uniref:hypothetical protein n=1 Tax=Streptomyces sp. NPDC004232 TaxID=3154454 RepID=UPI0033BE35C0
MTTTPTATYRDRLAGYLAEVENWILGAEFDVQELERQIAEAERNLSHASHLCSMTVASARAVLDGGPDSVTFRTEIDRQFATVEAAMNVRVNRTNVDAHRQAVETLKAKQANARTALHQAQALRQRIELAAQADELPTVADELEALLGLGD